MSENLDFTSRYDVFGPPNGCKDECEGTGFVPIYVSEGDKVYEWLWLFCEFKKHSYDGWHFVPCPSCNEKGIHSLIHDVCFGWWPRPDQAQVRQP